MRLSALGRVRLAVLSRRQNGGIRIAHRLTLVLANLVQRFARDIFRAGLIEWVRYWRERSRGRLRRRVGRVLVQERLLGVKLFSESNQFLRTGRGPSQR